MGGDKNIDKDESIVFGCGESLYNHNLLGTQKLAVD